MKKIKNLIGIITLLAGAATVATALDTNLPDYKSLSNLVGQGSGYVKTKEGNYVKCLYFHHDRDLYNPVSKSSKGVDLIEYRLLKLTEIGRPMWDKHPYIIIVDDDFDGFADREFVDNGEVKDGIFDEVNDLKGNGINMNHFDHKSYRK